MGRLSEGMERLAERLLEKNGEAITYTRGATTLNLTAFPDLTQETVETTNGQTAVRETFRTFKLDPATIVFASVVSAPLKGDRIGWDGKVWEAAAIIEGEKCWKPCDSHGHMIRTYTRQES